MYVLTICFSITQFVLSTNSAFRPTLGVMHGGFDDVIVIVCSGYGIDRAGLKVRCIQLVKVSL